MKAQVSVEFLMVTLVLTACLLLIFPQVIKLEGAASKSLSLYKARSLAESAYSACEISGITGEKQFLQSGANLAANSTHITAEDGAVSFSRRIDFACNITKSNGTIILSSG